MVMEALQEDTGDGNTQCTYHTSKSTNAAPGGGGICAFCLQEKLGKLISSSFPLPLFPSSSSGSSPSPSTRSNNQKKNNKEFAPASAAAIDEQGSLVFERSNTEFSPRKRRFWSFLLHLSKQSNGSFPQRSRMREEIATAAAVEKNNDDPAGFERKVSRSRSVGCGSRSFSGDFFERISTGFGDCTLRRVESQREGKVKATPVHRHHGGGEDRVKCGGIFNGFTVTSSSTSSSSSYWVSSSSMNPKAAAGRGAHGRSKSWGWAFASPIRALNTTKPNSGKRGGGSNKHTTTSNLNAVPSLLSKTSFELVN